MAANIFTIDVEEYYHAENILYSLSDKMIGALQSRVEVGTRKLLDILNKYSSKATFFVLGCVAEKHPGLISEIATAGHEIASHGYSHIPLYEHTLKTFDEDLGASVKILSDITGRKVIGYRATSFSYSDRIEWFCDVLAKHGIVYDSSMCCSFFRKSCNIAPSVSGRIIIKNGIEELPISFLGLGPAKIPLGGGYFRVLPWWTTSWGMGQARARNSGAVVFYIHPWELDHNQPRVNISTSKYMRHYVGLCGTEKKLAWLLKHNNFISIRCYLETLREKI